VISSAVVVELRSTTNPAVGDARWSLADPLRDLGVDTEAVPVTRSGPTVDSIVDLAESRALVIAVRDAYRSDWQRSWVSALLERRPDAVLVGLGMPHDLDLGAATTVLAYGAGRANTVAAARRLAGQWR
jgi:beta-N-acetylhexosaminidase